MARSCASSRRAGENIPPGRAGVAAPAAGALPGAGWAERGIATARITSREESTDGEAKIVADATFCKGSAALALRPLLPRPIARRRRRRRARVTPALIEAAKKEGKVVWYTSVDLPVAERIAKAFEAKYPGHRRAGRALRRRAHLPAHRPGIRQPHPRGRRRQLARMPRISSSGSATAGSRPTCRRTSPSIIRPSTRTPTGSSPASAPGSASSATTPSW